MWVILYKRQGALLLLNLYIRIYTIYCFIVTANNDKVAMF